MMFHAPTLEELSAKATEIGTILRTAGILPDMETNIALALLFARTLAGQMPEEAKGDSAETLRQVLRELAPAMLAEMVNAQAVALELEQGAPENTGTRWRL